jgi:predicted negative regulator of RcsB-dependent stress response
MATPSAAPHPRPSTTDDDIFLARALEFSAWAKKNIQLIVGIGIVLLLLVAGLFWYRAQQAKRQQRAATEFIGLQQMADMGEPNAAAAEMHAFIRR